MLPLPVHQRLAASLYKEGNDDPLSADGSKLITLDRIIINQVLKSTQINMIFSYKNNINKRCFKPLHIYL